VLRYENEQYKYFAHHDSIYEREIFLNMTLDKGTYTIIPISLGLGLKQQVKPPLRKYSTKDPVVR